MQTETVPPAILAADKLAKAERAPRTKTFGPLHEVTIPAVTTAVAAHYLNRRPQTLRYWAMSETGPITPIRIYGRLAWSVAELRRVLGVA